PTTSGILGAQSHRTKAVRRSLSDVYLADTAEVLAESENKLSQTRRAKDLADVHGRLYPTRAKHWPDPEPGNPDMATCSQAYSSTRRQRRGLIPGGATDSVFRCCPWFESPESSPGILAWVASLRELVLPLIRKAFLDDPRGWHPHPPIGSLLRSLLLAQPLYRFLYQTTGARGFLSTVKWKPWSHRPADVMADTFSQDEMLGVVCVTHVIYGYLV